MWYDIINKKWGINMDNLLEGLNEQQKKAVVHIKGPCLVIAGAGSGKTKVLTTRIAYLISQGIRSSNILAITFTNKAAKEMKERLAKLVPDNYAFLGTFHSLGVRILRENYSDIGYTSNITILDTDDTKSLIKRILKTQKEQLYLNPKNQPYYMNLFMLEIKLYQ